MRRGPPSAAPSIATGCSRKGSGPEWKPERAKFVLVNSEGGHITAFVDPGFPGAGAASPYYETSEAMGGSSASRRLAPFDSSM